MLKVKRFGTCSGLLQDLGIKQEPAGKSSNIYSTVCCISVEKVGFPCCYFGF